MMMKADSYLSNQTLMSNVLSDDGNFGHYGLAAAVGL